MLPGFKVIYKNKEINDAEFSKLLNDGIHIQEFTIRCDNITGIVPLVANLAKDAQFITYGD